MFSTVKAGARAQQENLSKGSEGLSHRQAKGKPSEERESLSLDASGYVAKEGGFLKEGW